MTNKPKPPTKESDDAFFEEVIKTQAIIYEIADSLCVVGSHLVLVDDGLPTEFVSRHACVKMLLYAALDLSANVDHYVHSISEVLECTGEVRIVRHHIPEPDESIKH